MQLPATPFAALSRPRRLVAAGAVLAAMLILLVVALQPVPAGAPRTGPGDLATYLEIIARLRAGEAYYPAAHAELLAGGFGTQSVFNWRTPFWPMAQAWFSGELLVYALGALSLFLVWRRFRALGGADFALLAVGALSINLVFVVAPGAAAFAEIPAGLLILCSILAYGLGWRWLGVLAAVAALFVRELAAPYLIVCLVFAIRDRQWRELAALGAGLLAYAGYFAWHAAEVAAQLGPLDRAYPDSWLALGGLGFLLKAAAFNGLLTALPLWVSAIVFPFALAGLVVSRDARALAMVVPYLAAFLFLGKPYNTYWGAMVTPTLMLGLPWALAAVRSLRWSSAAPAGAPRSGS